MKRTYLHLTSLILLFITASCAVDWESTTPKEDEKDKADSNSQIVLNIKTPGGFSSGAATRSLTIDDERKIDNIWVLTFDSAGDLSEIRKGGNLTTVDATTSSFTISIKGSNTASDTYNLMVLANAEDIIKNTIGIDIALIIDKGYAEITRSLNEAITGKMYPSGGVIPMWGESGAKEIKRGANNIISLSLMRSVARIDIGVGAPTYDTNNSTYKWTGKDDKDNKIPFEIKEVYVIKPNNSYLVIPSGAITNNKVSLPTIPTNAVQFTMEQSKANFRFEGTTEITASTADMGSYTTQSIYIPEANIKLAIGAKSGDANHENRMAVVVGGDYNNTGQITYYRLDLANRGNILDALRNHLYQINISKVSGFGYADVETAYKPLAMNMTVDILAWDEANMDDVVFDGQHYFSIEKRLITFTPMGQETSTLQIKTNVADFEMWEELSDGSEKMGLNPKSKTEHSNTQKGYDYKLTHNGGDMYTLKITANKHNVSHTRPDRENKWKIKANRLSATFTVDQQNTILYISYINGQSATLFPEGTAGNIKIPIDIMAVVPVTISADNWINIGGMTNIPTDANGLYTARIDVVVDTYQYSAVGLDRSGKITVSPEGEQPRIFTITQQVPYLKFVTTEESIQRSKTGHIFKGYVEVLTNIMTSDLTINRTNGTGSGNERIESATTFYNVDNAHPRNVRFDITADMTNTTEPVPVTEFSADFSVTANAKYGSMTSPTVKYKVAQASIIFKWFWYGGSGAPFDWTAPIEDIKRNYIFPWHIEKLTYNVITTVGVADDNAHSNDKRFGGSVTEGTPSANSDGHDIQPLIFSFNNTNYNAVKDYAIYFKSTATLPIPLSDYISFKQGSQLWSRTQVVSPYEIGCKGIAQVSAPKTNITNNVEWSVYGSGNPTWLTLRAGTTGSWDKYTNTTPLVVDDRITEPVIYDAAAPNLANALLVKTTSLAWAVEAWDALNPDPTTRSTTLTFANKSLDNIKLGVNISTETFEAKQYAPILKHISGVPTVTDIYFGDKSTIKVSTNLQNWGVRVYLGDDNKGTKLLEKVFGSTPAISDKSPSQHSVDITVPLHEGTVDRNISFYLYHTEASITTKDVKIETVSQITTRLIIGYFGGWNGVEYTKLLQVQSTNSEPLDWKTSITQTQGTFSDQNGLDNITALRQGDTNLNNFPAAKYCFNKGDGWYLPSKNQLLAIQVALEAVPTPYPFISDVYHSSTPQSASTSVWQVKFVPTDFRMGPFDMSAKQYVRCVRDVTP